MNEQKYTPEKISEIEKSRRKIESVAEEDVKYYKTKDSMEVLQRYAKEEDEMRDDDLSIKAQAKGRELSELVEAGKVEVPEEIQRVVQEASDSFWKKFDDYVKAIQNGQKAEAPSRNMHAILYINKFGESEDSREGAIADGYWGRLFDKALNERGIPNSIEVVNNILYSGILPKGLKLPD